MVDAVDLLDNFVKSRPADEIALEAQLKILGFLHDEFEYARPSIVIGIYFVYRFTSRAERKMEMVPTLFVNVQSILRKYSQKDFFTGSSVKKLVK